MKYELWSAASGNRIGGFESIPDLADVVRSFAELNGVLAIEDLFAEGWAAGAHEPTESLNSAQLRELARPLVRFYVYPAEPARTSTAASTLRTQRMPAAIPG